MAELGWGDQGAVDITFSAAAAMATKYVAVMLNSTPGQVAVATDGSAAMIGILQETAAAAGDAVRVRVHGTSLVHANGAFSIGDPIQSVDTTGYVDTAGAGEHAIGIALEAATAAADEVLVFVHKFSVPA